MLGMSCELPPVGLEEPPEAPVLLKLSLKLNLNLKLGLKPNL